MHAKSTIKSPLFGVVVFILQSKFIAVIIKKSDFMAFLQLKFRSVSLVQDASVNREFKDDYISKTVLSEIQLL
jgi:hypothetical protein